MFYLRQLRSTIIRRTISVTLLVVFVVGFVGLPILPDSSKNGRFPCENCPCGCSTAAFCWDKCCCHSDAEKLQWAKDNDVQPPEFLVARFQKTSHSLASTSAGTCCCGSKSTCGKPLAKSTSDSVATARGEDSNEHSSIRFVSLEDAARCHGIDLLWSILSCITIQLASSDTTGAEPPFLYLLSTADEFAASALRLFDPPIP